jgi:hypothetical protein
VDCAVSEVISSILIVFLVIAAGMVAGVYIFGSVDAGYLEKPSFAYFSTDTVLGIGGDGNADVPVIRISQSQGDRLEQHYTEGTHSGIEGMTITLVDPDGDAHEVVQSITMKGDSVDIAEGYYIFYYDLANPAESDYWITNDPGRIFGPRYHVHPFPITGTWEIIITDEDHQDTVVADIPVSL